MTGVLLNPEGLLNSRDVIPRRLNQTFLALKVEEEVHELRNARGL